MSKLYPPIIEETLPAFYSENGMVKITIPFSMNRAVSYSQIVGFELKIKTLQNGTLLYTIETYKPNNFSLDKENLSVTFYIKDETQKFKIGQFYKVQLAYIYIDETEKNNFLNDYYGGKISLDEYEIALSQHKEVGYYSGTSVIKYTTKPKLYINNLRAGFLNSYSNSYTGCYEQISSETDKKDTTEKVYSYKFDVYDDSGKTIFYTSGYKLHNTSLDNNIDFSQDIFDLNKDIEYDNIYYIQYSVITNNGLSLSTPKYKIVNRELIDAQINTEIDTILNFEEGYIDIRLLGHRNELGLQDLVTGSFLLLRTDENSEYKNWIELTRFKLNNEAPSPDEIIYRDFTFIQGKKYQYAIQQYSDNDLYSNKVYSKIVQGDFEHAFLYDGKRQLKIKYNSKITKFTNTRLEQKIDTIGGQYPFIFRNGQVNYNEFPIGGLISYFMDEKHLFIPEADLITDEKTTNYTTDNVAQERLFKMEVLKWLNDGQPKIFRSPTEGNFIVRLLKVSLSPEQKLGNLLHNFSCTAYEIADYTYENLCKYNFIISGDFENNILNFATIDLTDSILGTNLNLNKQILQTVRCDNMIPGEELLITFTDGSQEIITIGATGQYFINNSLPIEAISIIPRYEEVKVLKDQDFKLYYIKDEKDQSLKYAMDTNLGFDLFETYYKIVNTQPVKFENGQPIYKPQQGLITYSYFTTQENSFGLINNVVMDDCTVEQIIGECDNVLDNIACFKFNGKIKKHPSKTITNYYTITIRPRVVEYCDEIKGNNIILYDNIVNMNLRHPFTIYFEKASGKYIDVNNNKQYEDYEPYIIINNNERIYITRDIELDLSQYENLKNIKCGNGVIIEIAYQTKSTIYTIESSNPDILKEKNNYLNAVKDYENANKDQIKYRWDNMINKYNTYLNVLNENLIKEGVISQ